jgi:hypothetical protein
MAADAMAAPNRVRFSALLKFVMCCSYVVVNALTTLECQWATCRVNLN